MISTRISGRARSAFTQARAGGFSGSTQAFHTEFMSANSAMSLIHRLAESRFDLLVPAWARYPSILSRICLVWPLMSCVASLAVSPARYTVLSRTTQRLIRGPGGWVKSKRLMAIGWFPLSGGAERTDEAGLSPGQKEAIRN